MGYCNRAIVNKLQLFLKSRLLFQTSYRIVWKVKSSVWNPCDPSTFLPCNAFVWFSFGSILVTKRVMLNKWWCCQNFRNSKLCCTMIMFQSWIRTYLEVLNISEKLSFERGFGPSFGPIFLFKPSSRCNTHADTDINWCWLTWWTLSNNRNYFYCMRQHLTFVLYIAFAILVCKIKLAEVFLMFKLVLKLFSCQ